MTLNDSRATNSVESDGFRARNSAPKDHAFTYIAEDKERGERVIETYRKWSREVRKPEDVFKPETGLDQFGNLRTDLFQRLRSERNNSPVVLAE